MAGRVGAPGSGTEGGEAGGCVDAALTLAPPALPKVALTTHSRLRGPTESIWTGRYRRYRMWQRWIRARTRLMRIRYQSLPAGRAAGPRAIFDPEAARSPRALSASAAEVQRRRRRSLVLELVGTARYNFISTFSRATISGNVSPQFYVHITLPRTETAILSAACIKTSTTPNDLPPPPPRSETFSGLTSI